MSDDVNDVMHKVRYVQVYTQLAHLSSSRMLSSGPWDCLALVDCLETSLPDQSADAVQGEGMKHVSYLVHAQDIRGG